MTIMQCSFDNKNWYDIDDGPFGIPAASVQVYFRVKPKWRYQISWSNSDGSFEEHYDVWHNAVRKIKELEGFGQECNVYVRDTN